MIASLYEPYRRWSTGGSIYILSDLHFDDEKCKQKTPDWVTPEKQLDIINSMIRKNDTFVCLGDVGRAEYMKEIKAGKKVLLMGNHDKRSMCEAFFDEIYAGPLFISEKILLSHEPVHGLKWCLNIHGHDHANAESYIEGCKHLNLASNICGYTPVNLGQLIKNGILSNIPTIHRTVIEQRKTS